LVAPFRFNVPVNVSVYEAVVVVVVVVGDVVELLQAEAVSPSASSAAIVNRLIGLLDACLLWGFREPRDSPDF
jgi:hypothetical protein